MSDDSSKGPLTPQQERFCEEFIVDLNGTKAAIRANYSAKTATQSASRLMNDERVIARVQKLMDERSKRTKVTSDIVLRELLRIATVDLSEAYDDEGNLKDVKDMPEDIRRAIAGIEVTTEWTEIDGEQRPTGQTKKVRFWDKPRSLELLGKHLKLFTDKIEIDDKSGLAEKIARARKRTKK